MKDQSVKTRKYQNFSVLLSIYIKENPTHLDIALASILKNQTILPTEVVIVEDGPLTKDLYKVLKKYKKEFPDIMKFIPLEKNGGLGKALHIGLTNCTNDLVMRMDTDDVCVPNRFEKQLAFMKKNKDVSIVGGYITEFEENPEEPLRIKTMPCTYAEICKYAKFRNPLNHMTVCFRKKDILEVGNYQPVDYLEDQYLWSRILVSGKKIENIPEVLVHARIGNGFSERRGSKKYIAGWKMLQKYLYENKFINFYEKKRNLLAMYAFIYMPTWLRDFLYNKILRKGSK